MNRRRFLAGAGTALTGTLVTGSVSGAGDEDEGRNPITVDRGETNGASLELSGENAMTEAEMIEYAESKAKEDGVAVTDVVPSAVDSDGVSTQAAEIDTTKLGYVGGWNLEYDITCCPGNDVIGKVDNTLSMYRGDYRSDGDQWIYFFWLWSNGKPQSIWQLDAIRSKLDVQDSDVEVTDFSPSSRVNKGESTDVGYNISTPGGTIGISGQASTSETYQHNKSVDVDDAGHVTVELKDATGFWDSWSSPQQINACVQVRSDQNYRPGSDIPGSDFYWRVWGE